MLRRYQTNKTYYKQRGHQNRVWETRKTIKVKINVGYDWGKKAAPMIHVTTFALLFNILRSYATTAKESTKITEKDLAKVRRILEKERRSNPGLEGIAIAKEIMDITDLRPKFACLDLDEIASIASKVYRALQKQNNLTRDR